MKRWGEGLVAGEKGAFLDVFLSLAQQVEGFVAVFANGCHGIADLAEQLVFFGEAKDRLGEIIVFLDHPVHLIARGGALLFSRARGHP